MWVPAVSSLVQQLHAGNSFELPYLQHYIQSDLDSRVPLFKDAVARGVSPSKITTRYLESAFSTSMVRAQL